jgi:curved DNA-binding protein
MAEDYYSILGVSRTASPEEIQKAYRTVARKYHPDLNPDDKKAKEKFQNVQKAFETLNDEKKRKLYDQFGSDYERMGAGGGAGPFPGGGGNWSGQMPEGFDGIDLGQIFGGMGGGGGFGNIFEQMRGGGRGNAKNRRARNTSQPGNDIQQEITVPFAVAMMGGKVEIQIAHEAGKQEKLSVKIPPGINDGGRIRLRGKGEPGQRGGIDGDLFLVVRVASHPHFARIGDNLEVKVPVTLAEALLGTKVDIPTPDGIISIKIPEATSSGKKLRIKGHGIKRADETRGDLFAVIQIVLPEHPTEELQKAVQNQPKAGNPRNDLTW